MTVMTFQSTDSDTQVTTTGWTEIISKTFTLESSGDYIVWVSVEYTNAAVNRVASVRVVVDDVEQAISSQLPAVANEFMTFAPVILLSLNSGNHTIKLEGRTSNASYATTVRRKRLVVMKH